MAVKFADSAVVVVNGEIVLRGTRDQLAASDEMVRHYLGGRVLEQS